MDIEDEFTVDVISSTSKNRLERKVLKPLCKTKSKTTLHKQIQSNSSNLIGLDIISPIVIEYFCFFPLVNCLLNADR